MKPEDVPEAALNMALVLYHRVEPHEGGEAAMRHALAAVIPLVVAAEREAVVQAVQQHRFRPDARLVHGKNERASLIAPRNARAEIIALIRARNTP